MRRAPVRSLLAPSEVELIIMRLQNRSDAMGGGYVCCPLPTRNLFDAIVSFRSFGSSSRTRASSTSPSSVPARLAEAKAEERGRRRSGITTSTPSRRTRSQVILGVMLKFLCTSHLNSYSTATVNFLHISCCEDASSSFGRNVERIPPMNTLIKCTEIHATYL